MSTEMHVVDVRKKEVMELLNLWKKKWWSIYTTEQQLVWHMTFQMWLDNSDATHLDFHITDSSQSTSGCTPCSFCSFISSPVACLFQT
jgi:hypothetical protein